MYRDYGITSDGKGEWDFGNASARNVMIFDLDNSSSSHSDNGKNNFLVSGEVPSYDINRSFGAPVKKFGKTRKKPYSRVSFTFNVIFV